MRLGRGVVSQSARVVMLAICVLGVSVYFWTDNVSKDLGLAFVDLLVVGLAVFWMKETHRFAEKNPAQALLEGADLTRYHAQELKAAGQRVETRPILVEDRGAVGQLTHVGGEPGQ